MREIKFRAWDGEKFGYVTLHPQSISVPTAEVWKRSSYSADHISFSNLKDWQQSTGLKDKNGKEIYEGDLLRVVGAESGEMVVHVDDITCMPLSTLYPAGEIIGNVHENPELTNDHDNGNV